MLFAKVDCSCASFLLLDKLNTRLGKGPMKKEKFKPILLFLLVIVLFMMMISCAHTPGVIGKWREIGKTATLEFSKDGSFKAVDNQGRGLGSGGLGSGLRYCNSGNCLNNDFIASANLKSVLGRI